MEARARTAGDSDEEEREEKIGRAAPADGGKARERVGRKHRMRDKDADEAEAHHRVEEIGVQVVARLEENPHGASRREEAVDEEDDRPDHADRLGFKAPLGEVERIEVADPHKGEHERHEEERRPEDRHLPLVHAEPEEYRLAYEEKRGRRNRGICDEGAGDLARELRHDEDERRPAEKQKEHLAWPAKNRPDDGADRFAAMPHREEERDHVVRRAYKNTAEDDPQDDGSPAELRGEDRTYNWPCASYRGKVMAKENRRVGGNEVDAVFLRVSWSRDRRVNPELALYQLRVDKVSCEKRSRSDEKKYGTIHFTAPLLRMRRRCGTSSSKGLPP